jgi:hypothetical protein
VADDIPSVIAGHLTSWGDVESRSEVRLLRTLVIAAGIGCAILFVVIGPHYELQLYADGSLFSYSVAVQDAWAFHWHNISGRVFVYLFTEAPAEIYVGLTHDVRRGIALYGFLFFAAQLLGLVVTWLVDGSSNRVIFTFACASTACLCPLVFGFPTEMWIAHAVFWPTLAVCHYSRGGITGNILIFAMLLALVLSHEGGLVLAVVIGITLVLRAPEDAAFLRAAGCLLASLSIWTLVKLTLPPDAYDGPMMRRAAFHFFEPAIFTSYMCVLLFGVLAGYGILFLVFRRLARPSAHIFAALFVAVALAAYWLWLDRELHGEQRYYARTVLLLATGALGGLAGVFVLETEDRLNLPVPGLLRLMATLKADTTVRAVTGAMLVVMLVHAVETAKFVRTWTAYKAAVLALTTGTTSDPALGDPRFVSSARISADLNRLSWFSTTPYLSVLLAPGFVPARLVVDPTANYFWLSCETATANKKADRAIPVESRRLVRVYACLHR